MRNESAEWTQADLLGFLSDYRQRERRHLGERLRQDSERLGTLGSRLRSGAENGACWSAQEILVHLLQTSRAFSALALGIASGRVTEFDLLSAARQRDERAAAMSSLAPQQLIHEAQASLLRMAEYLDQVSIDELERSALLMDGMTLSATEVIRLLVCAHLEIHLDQMEEALQTG